MKRILLVSCAVLICFQFTNAQGGDATKGLYVLPQDQKFVEMEKTLWDAWKIKDQKLYEDLLSDKFFEVDVTGTYDKATEISYMDKCDLKDYAILDPQVRHLNSETVLLTYKATVHDICEGQPVPEHLIMNIVFVRERGKWLKVLDSEVPKSEYGNWQVVASETKRVPRQSPTSQLNVRDRLIGSWKQVSDEEKLPDGSIVPLDEVGLVTYDASGHMSGQTMRVSEPKQQLPSDSIYLNNGYDAYFGTFTVDDAKHTITHHVEGSVSRQLVGKDLVRSYSFEGDRLILKPTSPNEHWTVVLEKN